MKTDIQWAELHAPLFLAGTNLGQKLDPTKRLGLKMAYDEDKRHLFVSYNGKAARVPETSVLSMVEYEAAPVKAAPHPFPSQSQFHDDEKPNQSVATATSQVSTPMSHVHAGQGFGQTGQETPVKRGPGRPPKVEL